jgi:hypothetical protein
VAYWQRRALAFEAARPRPGDYTGGPVDWETGCQLGPGADTEAADGRLAAAASECRSRADELRADDWEAIR